jgi:hypothetical protein
MGCLLIMRTARTAVSGRKSDTRNEEEIFDKR